MDEATKVEIRKIREESKPFGREEIKCLNCPYTWGECNYWRRKRHGFMCRREEEIKKEKEKEILEYHLIDKNSFLIHFLHFLFFFRAKINNRISNCTSNEKRNIAMYSLGTK